MLLKEQPVVAHQEEAADAEGNNMKKAKIEIVGMHCSSCASNVERSLKKTPGVRDARVSLLLKKGTAEIEDNVKEEALKVAVKRAGYNVKSISYE